MAIPAAVAPGPVETRVRALVLEIFDAADLAASVFTQALKARSAAFLLLAHAEIESSLEQECHRTAALLRSASEPATAMLAWGFTSVRVDGSAQRPRKKTPLEELVSTYEQVVESNHGVKQHNLSSLLVPLGVDLQAIKTDVLALDSFGSRRGDLAHQPLSAWNTSDLPSVHVNSAIQAGQSADRLIAAIRVGHSRITPAPHPKAISWRRRIAVLLRRAASIIDGR